MTLSFPWTANRDRRQRALDAALAKDHDGGILDNTIGFLGNAMAAPGAGMLSHVLGAKQQPVPQQIAKDSGLDIGQVMT